MIFEPGPERPGGRFYFWTKRKRDKAIMREWWLRAWFWAGIHEVILTGDTYANSGPNNDN